MSWLTDFEEEIVQEFATTEHFVVNVITDLKRGVEVAVKDVELVGAWVAKEIPVVVNALRPFLGMLQVISIIDPTSKAAITAGIAAANIAVTALNKFADDKNSGATTAQSALDAFVAYKKAQSAVALVAAHVVAAPTAPLQVSAAPASTSQG